MPVVYKSSMQNNMQFGATTTIQNTGTAAISSWTLTWAFPNGQTVANMWNDGTWTQSGAIVTATNPSWDASIPAGTTIMGPAFNGNWNGITKRVAYVVRRQRNDLQLASGNHGCGAGSCDLLRTQQGRGSSAGLSAK